MRLALVQSSIVWGNVEENLERWDKLLSEHSGSDVIIFPEMFVSGSVMERKERGCVTQEIGRIASYYEQVKATMLLWAKQRDALVMGSTVCLEEGRYYNRLIAAFPDGRIEYYDKRHCFSMAGENDYIAAGKRQLVFEFRGVRIAVFICYDLRFPVWSRNTQGYDLAVYVANWPASRREVWKTLLKARAMENQCYVAGVNCVGTDNDGIVYSGDSLLFDAKGAVVATCGENEEKIIAADIDRERLYDFRKKFPVLEDRDHFDISTIK